MRGRRGTEILSADQVLARALAQEVLGKRSMRRFEDHRETGGLRLPMRIVSGNGDPRFDRVAEIEAAAIDEAPPAGAFDVAPQAFADVAFLAGGTQALVPFELLDNHVFVAVEIDGHALRVLLDTGGVNLLAATAARRMGLASVGAIEARGSGEASVGSGFARIGRRCPGAAPARRQRRRAGDPPRRRQHRRRDPAALRRHVRLHAPSGASGRQRRGGRSRPTARACGSIATRRGWSWAPSWKAVRRARAGRGPTT